MDRGPSYELGRFRHPSAKFPGGQYCVYIKSEHGPRRRVRLKIGLDRPEAEAQAAMHDFIRRRTAALLIEQGHRISELARLYFEDRERENKNVKNKKYAWYKHADSVFGPLTPADINAPLAVRGKDRTVCHKYAVQRQEGGARRATIHTELNLLRTIISWAAQKRFISLVPVWLPRRAHDRALELTQEEFETILAHCMHPHLRLFVIVAICTGARKSAILELTWDRVDFEKRTIDFRVNRDDEDILDSSGEKGRALVDMNQLCFAALSMMRGWARTAYVIEWNGKQVKNIKKALKTAIDSSGVQKPFLGAHAFRHSAATWIADAGQDLRVVQRLLGHGNISSTQIYAKHQRGYLATAVTVIDQKLNLDDILEGPQRAEETMGKRRIPGPKNPRRLPQFAVKD